MVLVLDGSSEYDAYAWSKFDNSICLMHLFMSMASSNLKSFTRDQCISSTMAWTFWIWISDSLTLGSIPVIFL